MAGSHVKIRDKTLPQIFCRFNITMIDLRDRIIDWQDHKWGENHKSYRLRYLGMDEMQDFLRSMSRFLLMP